jgi:hypothetical protein
MKPRPSYQHLLDAGRFRAACFFLTFIAVELEEINREENSRTVDYRYRK